MAQSVHEYLMCSNTFGQGVYSISENSKSHNSGLGSQMLVRPAFGWSLGLCREPLFLIPTDNQMKIYKRML